MVFDELKSEITRFVGPIPNLKVRDFKSCATAIEHGKVIRQLIKDVEEKRDSLVRPRNEEVKRINAYAAEIRGPLEDAKRYLEGQVAAYELEQAEIRRAEERRIEAERRQKERQLEAAAAAKREALMDAQSQDVDPLFGHIEEDGEAAEQAALDIERELEAKRAALAREAATKQNDLLYERRVKNVRMVWECEVVDIDKVPVEFLIREVNRPMVVAAARGGRTNIPGLRIFQRPSVGFGTHTRVPREALEAERDRKRLEEPATAEHRLGRSIPAGGTSTRRQRDRKSSGRKL